MNLKQTFQSSKRFIAAVALGGVMLVGLVGLLPGHAQKQEVMVKSGQVEEVAKLTLPGSLIPGGYVPNGNFWSA